ncbi:MAG: BatD family protein [Bdellovibrionales bacterium]
MWALILACVTTFSARGQDVDVQASVDRQEVAVGDVINFTVSVSSKNSVQVDEPRLSGLDGFELVNTSTGIETRSSFVNGQFVTEQSRNFNYLLVANKQGKLRLPPVSVHVDGKTLQTKPIEIVVAGERKGPPQAGRGGGQPQQPDPFDQMDSMEELFNQMLQRRLRPNMPPDGQPGRPFNPNEAFFIDASTDKKTAYVGEQVVANFYLYTKGQIRDIDTLKYPDLKGFWKEDLEMATRLNFEQVVLNGQAYQRALLVSYALFPIKAGKATVDQYKAKCTVITPSTFGFGRPYQFTKASKPIPIEVLDTPTENRPANFTGAVGHFRLTAQFEPPTGVTNQPVTLRVRIEGQGNAKLIELPKLELPPSFELYDQKSQAKFLKDGTSFKEFEVLIIPREPGIFDVPPVAISTFDPDSKTYQAVASQPLKLTVTGSPTQSPPGMATSAGTAPPVDSGPQLPPPVTDFHESLASRTIKPTITLVLFAAVFAFLGFQAWRQFRRKPKKVNLKLQLDRRLKRIHELAGKKDWRRLGVEMTNAVYWILGQISEQGGANQDLVKLLESTPPSLRNELSEPLRDLLAQCEALSFAPEKLIGEMTQPDKIRKQVQKLEKVLGRAIELAEV